MKRRDLFKYLGAAFGASVLPQVDLPKNTFIRYNISREALEDMKKWGVDQIDSHVQNIKISTDLTREEILELGRKSPYYRPVSFPITLSNCV